jgi:hypothetical protein
MNWDIRECKKVVGKCEVTISEILPRKKKKKNQSEEALLKSRYLRTMHWEGATLWRMLTDLLYHSV